MLDLLPAELVLTIVERTSDSPWDRKTLLDSICAVNKSYRRVFEPLAGRFVQVKSNDTLELIRETWSDAKKIAAHVLLIGPETSAGSTLEGCDVRLARRFLVSLPMIREVRFRNVNSLGRPKTTSATKVELCLSNRQMLFRIEALMLQRCFILVTTGIGCLPLNLKHLCIDLRTLDDRFCPALGLGTLLQTCYLPHLETLRLDCEEVPHVQPQFLAGLRLVQLAATPMDDPFAADPLDSEVPNSFLTTETPVLLTYWSWPTDEDCAKMNRPDLLHYVQLNMPEEDIATATMFLARLPNLKAAFVRVLPRRQEGAASPEPEVPASDADYNLHIASLERIMAARGVDLIWADSDEHAFISPSFARDSAMTHVLATPAV
ncbi:hypothetical protein BMF94_3291 [Rhodotorula taiwanensis]|uniref:F-box domain-containing protein n=1 Tax=Rhodotorula taiwanensis TaxID=741276 RepID=A0A2S5BAF3_9BASI|nr:hypothetical protein BMF94_3291 [Rhodotorula taiwanensis]